MTAALAAHRLYARHALSERDALRDVSLAIQPGEIVVLVGPNGAGKSTLLACLSGELRPRSGRVELFGTDVRRLSRRRLARRLARLPQEPVCPEGLSVEALVGCGRHPHSSYLGGLDGADQAAVREALAATDTSDLRRRGMETLSGGERRRAWLAMVLAQRSEVLVLDEPTAALDVRHQWEVVELLREANRERGVTILTAVHDLEQAAALAHRVAVMLRGRLYEIGPPEACLREEMLRDVFRVDARIEKEDGRLRVRIGGPADALRSL